MEDINSFECRDMIIEFVNSCDDLNRVFWWVFVSGTADHNATDEAREYRKAQLTVEPVLHNWLNLKDEAEINFPALSECLFSVVHANFNRTCLLQNSASFAIEISLPHLHNEVASLTFTEKAFKACTDFLRYIQMEVYSFCPDNEKPIEKELEFAYGSGVPGLTDCYSQFYPAEFVDYIYREFDYLSSDEIASSESVDTKETPEPSFENLKPTAKRRAELAWKTEGHSVSFEDARSDHNKEITSNSAKETQKELNQKMQEDSECHCRSRVFQSKKFPVNKQ